MTISTYNLETDENGAYQITEMVLKSINESKVKGGICLVFIPHTTAGLSITSFWEKEGLDDIHDEINRIIPTRIDFKHQTDTPQDAAGHIKSVLIGSSLNLIIEKGQLLLGHSQGIFFNEFDGPRKRKFYVKCFCA